MAAALLQRVRALPESVSFALTVAAFESQGSRSVIDAAVGDDPSAALRTAEEAGPDRGGPGVGPVLASTGARRARVLDDTTTFAAGSTGRWRSPSRRMGSVTTRPSTSVNRPRAPTTRSPTGSKRCRWKRPAAETMAAASTLAWRAGALRTDRDQRARDWLRSGSEAATAGITYAARLEAALEETDDPSLIAEIQVTRARLATLGGDPDFAVELLDSHGETIIAAAPFLGAVLTALAGSCAWMRADGTATRVLADQAVALVGGQVTAEMTPIANFLIRAGAATGYDDPALAVSTARMIRESGQTEFAGPALFCLLVADQIAEADAFYRWAIAAARDAGSITDVAWLHGPATLLLCRQGHLDAAYAAGSEAIDLAPFVIGPFPLAQAHSALAYVSAVRGDRARCEEHVAETVPSRRPPPTSRSPGLRLAMPVRWPCSATA